MVYRKMKTNTYWGLWKKKNQTVEILYIQTDIAETTHSLKSENYCRNMSNSSFLNSNSILDNNISKYNSSKSLQ